MTEPITMAAFVATHQLTMTCEPADSNPNMNDSQDMDHWKCTLRLKRFRMTVPFSMGSGHHGAESSITGVLSCLASDAASVDQSSFEEWCSELGYDVDSRKAERTYKICQRQAAKLKTFLGEYQYRDLLYSTEGD